MAAEDILTDDYVADMLAKEAKESSIKYSTMGLQAFVSSKPSPKKPKPNTRFLRNIIKDTDNHNAALLAKEVADARKRLCSLPNSGPRDTGMDKSTGDIRMRQLGDIAAILGGRKTKRRRVEETDESTRQVPSRSEYEANKDLEKGQKSRRRVSNRYSERDHSDRVRGPKDRRFKGALDALGGREKQEVGKRRHGSMSRSRSPKDHFSMYREMIPKRRRSRSPKADGSRHRSQRSHRGRSPCSPDYKLSREKDNCKHQQPEPREDYDSDPLETILGPMPPPPFNPPLVTRGRGTHSQASGIDSRFSISYDPSADVMPEIDEENDWDQALEALRDRQKFKEKGMDRLRMAGFTEEEIKRMEGGGEKKQEHVRWAKKGEGREWDRGKVIDAKGDVAFDVKFGKVIVGDFGVESTFGRLKD